MPSPGKWGHVCAQISLPAYLNSAARATFFLTKTKQQATLIIRHPDDGKLYVNFDQEILQLIREAKILDRMGIEIPESAKIALFQAREPNL